MTDQQAVKVLGYLYRMIEAGERGYAVSAANVNNRGMKVLLKSYAQQRVRFKSEIFAEVQRLGGETKPRSSIRGVLHRGRIHIFAALTIGNEEREKVVLKEVLVGEKVALRTYQKTLEADLPAKTHDIVARQYEEVNKTVEQIQLMRGKEAKRMMVQLFDSAQEADEVLQELQVAGVRLESIQKAAFDDTIELYKGIGTTVFETIISGAVGGALWGSLIGAIAGISTQQVASLGSSPLPVIDLWSLTALAGILGGAIIGGILGLALGIGISEDDTYLYDESIQHGQMILMALVDGVHAPEARRIMARPNFTVKAPIDESQLDSA